MSKLPPPNQIGQYEIVRRLGAGGMAEVFLARKRGAEGTYKLLVVKRILPSHETSRRFRAMFVEEAQLATRLNHPNVVQVFEFQDSGDEGQLLAMEYVEGPDLGLLMSSAKAHGTRIPPWTAAWIIAEAAKGLHYAHEKKDETGTPLEIVHRDVSPQNILLSYEGAVKIADFGIATAKLFHEEQGTLKGKFAYMSPEQARGEKVDRRSDMYALAVVLWEILAGRPLHGGIGGEALLDAVRSGPVERPGACAGDVPPELDEIVMKALAADKKDRFATCRELASALGRALMIRQQLVDAATLEALVEQLVVRDPHGAAQELALSLQLPPEHRTQAAGPAARSALLSDGQSRVPSASVSDEDASPALASAIGPREVRHVAIVTIKLHGWDDLVHADAALATRTHERLKTMLGDIAFKRNLRMWTWSSDHEARAIAGLTSNPGRAAADSALAALDTHEVVAGLSEDLPMKVSAAIGVVRGIASGTRDPAGNLVRYTLHDPVTYLADVLSGAVPAEQTWVAGGLYRLVRRDFRWGDAPSLALAKREGVPAQMRIYSLERGLSREERLSNAMSGQADLVGRDAEKADLGAAFHHAVNGPSGSGLVVFRAVVGEIGIGKTALVGAFLAELPPNARIVRAEATPVRQEVPFAVIADLVRDLVGATGEEPFDEVAKLIASAGGGAAKGDATNPMVARLAELATGRQLGGNDDEDAAGRQRVVTSGVRTLLAAIAIDQPVVCVIDSLQWADAQSLDLLTELAKMADPLPVLAILVTRPDDHVAGVLEGMMRLDLRGLSAEEQVRLVETRLGVTDGVRQVCADLLPRVGGNPFFLLEMVDALLERGALEIKEIERPGGDAVHVLVSTGRAGATLPSTLEQLLADRIQELPMQERVVVDWLAIAGGPLHVSDLAHLVTGWQEEEFTRLCARGLVDRKGNAADFRHPLTRDVAYGALGAQTRVRMHKSLGEHLETTSMARGVSAAIVARHLVRGEEGARAAVYYIEAGNAARARYETQLAIRCFRRALGLLPDDDAHLLVVHDALESVYRMLGRRHDRTLHIAGLRKIARTLGTPRAACLALARTALFDLDEGRLAHGLPVARHAADLAHANHLVQLEIETEALLSELLRELGDVQGALAACDRALASADPAVNPGVPPRLRAEVLRSRGVLLRRVGRVREAMTAYAGAIAVFRKTGARRQEARAKISLGFAAFVQGHYEDAIALALESIQINVSIGGRFQIANTLANVGAGYASLGDMPRAQAYLSRARETHERYGDQDNRADTLVVSAEVMIEDNRLDDAVPLLQDANALNEATHNAYSGTHERVVRAVLARARRDAKTAIENAMQARHAAEQQALVSYHFYGMAVEAAARVDAGETHTGTLLATTALGAVETLQGCEYGLEVRVLCADALKRAGSPQAALAHQRSVDHARELFGWIRDPRLRKTFMARPIVAGLFETTPVPLSASAVASARSAASSDSSASPVEPRFLPGVLSDPDQAPHKDEQDR